MVFDWFRRKKKAISLQDLIADFHLHQEVMGRIERQCSLNKLGRSAEAHQDARETVKLVENHVKDNPADKRAHFLAAHFYHYVGFEEKAERTLANLLSQGAFKLEDDERLICEGAQQNIRRQRHLNARGKDGPDGFTQVYSCAKCGRLHNFLSMPCPHCDWFPESELDAAKSIVLSNAHLKIPQLLLLSREIASGRTAEDVVPDLKKSAAAYLNGDQQARAVRGVLSLLRENSQKTRRSINEVLGCPACGARMPFSGALHCGQCGEEIRWPKFLRSLACLDNLLWLWESRVEPDRSEEFAEFVCVLVLMMNDLLRKQEVPSEKNRRYALELLQKIGPVFDLKKGAAVDARDLEELKPYVFEDNRRDESQVFVTLIQQELKLFVAMMKSGIKI